MPSSSSSQSKCKLRTASEVISRLKWSYDETANAQNTIMGYDCRINGPLEKCVDDYNRINDGGDIPEHRIQYFRLNRLPLKESMLWDRLGRVDRLFGSGAGTEAPISPITLQNAAGAIETMKRLEEEKAIRAQEKAKRRARQHAKKAAAAKKFHIASIAHKAETEGSVPSAIKQRHTWQPLTHYYVFNQTASKWIQQLSSRWSNNQGKVLPEVRSEPLKVITWNVLFDLHRNENNEIVQGDDSLLGPTDNTETRWGNLMNILSQEDADIISLQEVTPRFLQQLQSQRWVQDLYSLSAADVHTTSLEPYGNLMLWKSASFHACGVYLCRDLNRNRALVVSLEAAYDEKATIFNVANVHLPADQRDAATGETKDRTLARQRELGAVIAKLQVLEQRVQKTISLPIILGDSIPVTTIQTCFKTTFLLMRGSILQVTKRMALHLIGNEIKGRKRQESMVIQREIRGESIGSSLCSFPPSDHFGLQLSFRFVEPPSPRMRLLYDPIQVVQNAWTTTATPTTESLLALVLEDCTVNVTKLYDSTSTLPLAHVTLLNGFVDLSSEETQKLATQAVEDAVRQTLYVQDPTQSWPFFVDQQSLNIFEHRESATLVCLPSVHENKGWLQQLYATLRVKFALCREQESRFAEGWTPHLSLGSFPTVSAARREMDRIFSSGSWVEQNDTVKLGVYGIGLFRRDVVDGKFYTVTTVPFAARRQIGIPLGDTKSFLENSGIAWSSTMNGASSVVLQELERACQNVSANLGDGRLESCAHVYGSHALGVSLPAISDVDIVIQVKPISATDNDTIRSIGSSQFLRGAASRLLDLHKEAKIRMRVSSASGVALYMLTIKLAPQYPSVDLMLARTDAVGKPVDVSSKTTLDSIADSKALLSSARSLQLLGSSLDVCKVYQGALRIIKLWAERRQIYGSSSGYLGGGGWAILLAWVLQQKGEDLEIKHSSTISLAAQQLASFFFRTALGLWANNKVITLGDVDKSILEHAADITLSRNTMAVLASKSGGNFGRSTTAATTQATYYEFRRAQEILQADPTALYDCLAPFEMQNSCERILALEVEIPQGENTPGLPKPADVKAWGATRVLNLLVALQRVVPPTEIRPSSKVVKKEGSFWFFVGIDGSAYPALADFALKHIDVLEQEWKATMAHTEIRLVNLTRDEYDQLFG